MNIEEELRMLADQVLLDEDPQALASHIADSIEAWIEVAGASTRDTMRLRSEIQFFRQESGE